MKNYFKDLKIDGHIKIDHMVDPLFLFFNLNKTLPNAHRFIKIDASVLKEKITKQFNIKKEQIIAYLTEQNEDIEDDEEYDATCLLIMIRKDLFILRESENRSTFVYYSSRYENSKLLSKIFDVIKKCKKKEELQKTIHLICDEGSNMYLKDFKIRPTELDVQKNYNNDFIETNDKIMHFLQNRERNGLVLLHGAPGTGKTTYIRHLITICERRVMYVPPDFAGIISSPSFLSFLTNHPGSVLVIEDAESSVQQRKGGDNSAVANLLNLCDGLLSDCLNMQVICTFNTDISKIDKALLRKGRMVAKYEFKPLEKHKAQILSDSLGFKNIITEDMTVAEIYNQREKGFEHNGMSKVGFQTN